MGRDVESLNAEGKVDRIQVFERLGKRRQMKHGGDHANDRNETPEIGDH